MDIDSIASLNKTQHKKLDTLMKGTNDFAYKKDSFVKSYNKKVPSKIFEVLEVLEKPSPGDPLMEMSVADPGKGKGGGMHGCTRNGGSGCSGNLDRNTGGNKEHKGIDLYAEQDTKLYSMYDGVVSSLFDKIKRNEYFSDSKKYSKTYGTSFPYEGSLGNDVQIKSTIKGKTVVIRYCHLNQINVKIGDKVTQGLLIGLTGRNGNAGKKKDKFQSAKPHLHIQIENNKNKDPMNYITTNFDKNGNKIQK